MNVECTLNVNGTTTILAGSAAEMDGRGVGDDLGIEIERHVGADLVLNRLQR